MNISKASRFLIEELDYGYFLATPVGTFLDAFGNEITYHILFHKKSDGEITDIQVCESGIWGNIYWSEKRMKQIQSRIFIKKLREQVAENKAA